MQNSDPGARRYTAEVLIASTEIDYISHAFLLDTQPFAKLKELCT